MKRKNLNILPFLMALLLTRCANQVAPTGGPRDVTPPRVVEAQPANHGVGFDGHTIEITFDEYITLNNAAQQVLFSPPLDAKPDIRLRNKTVVIKLNAPLRANTTYTVDFGEAVKDFHEGNLFKDYLYTFTTGEVLDTLSLSGQVLDAESHNPIEKLQVGLYLADTLHADSLFQRPCLQAPDYLARTDKNGRFVVHGLPDEPFLVFALEDMNANRYYDLPNEKAAFLDTLVCPSDSASLTLSAFIQTDTNQMLLESKLVEEGLLRFVFRQPADRVDFRAELPAVDSFQWVEVWSARHDTLNCWFTPNRADSVRVSILYDTLINRNESFNLRFRETRNRGRNNDKILTVKNNLKNSLLLPGDEFLLQFAEPIARVEGEWPFEQADESGLVYRYLEPVSDTAECALEIADSVFYSVRGRTNSALNWHFRRAQNSDLGNIYVTVVPPEGMQVVVQLTDNRGKVLAEQAIDSLSRVGFTGLVPAKYKLQALLDADRNGQWSSGNFFRRFLPEVIILYKDELELRAGWDIDLNEEWILR